MGPIILVILGLVIVFAMIIIGIYNKLVTLRQRYKNAFAQIDVQLKRRYDLIPNLVETVKGYMKHEKETLEAVINARNSAVSAQQGAAQSPGDPDAMNKLGQAEGQLGATLGRLFALSEAYPDLKANENMMQLTEELTTTENKVAFARQAFNDAVTAFNTAIEVFPAVMIAGAFGFKEASLFEVPEEERATVEEAPKVSFD